MLGSKKVTPQAPAEDSVENPVVEHPTRPGAKNRPTPKRKDAQAARRQPLVVADRKAAKAAEKERAREARLAQREAVARGDDKALPARDRGPQRRYIRDRVDARWTTGEVAMPVMLALLATILIRNAMLQWIVLLVLWLVVLAGVIDTFFLVRSIKKGLVKKFGSVEPGAGKYAASRSFQMRRTRLPRPMVKRGAKID